MSVWFGNLKGKTRLGRRHGSPVLWLFLSLSHTCPIHGREVLYVTRAFSSARRQCHAVCQGRFIACWIHLFLVFFFFSPRANVSSKEHSKPTKRHNSFCQMCHYDSIHSQTRKLQCLLQSHSLTSSHPSCPSSHLAREIKGKIVTGSYWNFIAMGDTLAEKLNLSQNPTLSLTDL